MVNGGFAVSTCCTTRAGCPLRRRPPPQHGQTWSRCSSTWGTSRGETARVHNWDDRAGPRRAGLEESSADGGLTMSEEGGLDEVDEFFLAAVSLLRLSLQWVPLLAVLICLIPQGVLGTRFSQT